MNQSTNVLKLQISKEGSHMTKFSQILNVGPLLFSIVSVVMVWMGLSPIQPKIQPVTTDTMLNNNGLIFIG